MKFYLITLRKTVIKNPTAAVTWEYTRGTALVPAPSVPHALLREGSTAGGPGTPPGVLGLTNTQAQ